MDAPASKDDKILDTSFKSDVFEPSTSTPAVSIKISNHIDLKDALKYTEYEEDDEDDEDDDDDDDDDDDEDIEQNPQENDEEYDDSSKTVEMCFSPPQNNRTLKKNSKHKKQKPKKPNLKKRNKNQQLINSAANIKQNEEALTLTDSVSSLQEDTNGTSLLNGSSSSVVVFTSSAPPTASIPSNASKLFDWNSRTLNSSASNAELNNFESKAKNSSSKRLEKSSDLDPFEREEVFSKINVLLKLALKNHQLKPSQQANEHASVPPTTPATAAIQNANRSLSSGLEYPRSSYHYTTQSSFNSQLHSKPVYCSSMSQVDESVKKTVAENVWKHIYDFFVHFDSRAENDEEIDRRIRDAQSIIPITIDDILNTNFSPVTQNMNDEIYNNMRTPSDYSYLYERKIYIDQLCYLYWLVEDELNRIGYVESLYPSIRLLRKSQPAYADPKFEASTKTLLLWYKIMKDLMNSCDILGKFLGFAKKPENLQYWTWFDQRYI
jgi:hypothetical protein